MRSLLPDVSDRPATPAATLVVFRRGRGGAAPELLMVQRSSRLRFAAGATVFPGGRVDPADVALARTSGWAGDIEEGAARIAAIRETLEEAGLLSGIRTAVTAEQAAVARARLFAGETLGEILVSNGWELDLDALIPFARWLPHEGVSRVFDTRFYLTDLGTGDVSLSADLTENTALFWSCAEATLRRADAGELAVIFPTRRNLERLALFADFTAAKRHAARHPVRTIRPRFEDRDAERWLCIDEGLGYPCLGEPAPRATKV